MSKRTPRKDLSKNSYDFTKPIDIFNLGGESDPCFGKLHDLTAPECMRCGDSELCQIATSQRQIIDRNSDSSKYMDIEHDNDHRAYKYIKRRVTLGKSEADIIKVAVAKYGVTKDEAKKIIKKLKG
jgi:hypothetical protein